MSETPKNQPSHIHRWWWVVLGISGVLFGLLGSPIYIPDSYEHVILAECMADGSSPRIDCANIAHAFRPPLPAVLLIATSFVAHPLYGIVLLSWLAVTTMPALLWRFAPPSLPKAQRVSMTVGLMTAPIFHTFSQLADARIIVLPLVLIFGLCLWQMFESPKKSGVVSVVAGLMVVLTTLTRPESILLLPLGAIWVWCYARGEIKRYALVALVPLVCWWGVLSKLAGRLVFAPRHWESTLLAAWEFMPLRWAKQHYGMGLWNPPARQSSLALSPASAIPDISLQDWFDWLVQGLSNCFSWWVLGVLFIVVVLGLKRRGTRPLLAILLICATPNLVGALLPQARDPMFQISNLFPLWLMVVLLMGWSIGRASLIFTTFRPVPLILMLAVFWFGSKAPAIKNGVEFTAAGHQTSQWLRNNTTQEQVVIASFESAPMVFLADRRWEQWPSRWDQNRLFADDDPILVVSSEDGFWTGNTYMGQTLPSPSAYFAIHNQWVVVFDMADK